MTKVGPVGISKHVDKTYKVDPGMYDDTFENPLKPDQSRRAPARTQATFQKRPTSNGAALAAEQLLASGSGSIPN